MNNTRISDDCEFLEMVNYIDCTNESSDELKLKRGLVYEKGTSNILASCFAYTDVYTIDDHDKIQNIIDNFSDWNFFYSLEATLIRLLYYNNEWRIITNKKLDAFKSRWSCRETFGQLFQNALCKIFSKDQDAILDWFFDLLDKEKIYCFLIKSNNENRIVCHYKKDSIVYLGTLNKGSEFVYDPLPPLDIPEFKQFATPTRIDVNSFADLESIVCNVNCYEYQGIIAIHKTINRQIKILNSEYKQLFELRNNNPNLRFRYLELRNDAALVEKFYKLYPKFAEVFDSYEDALYKISRIIYQYYVSRYIKNQFVTLPKEEFLVMKKCHDHYLKDRQNNKVFSKTVFHFLTNEPPLNLYKMIRRLHINLSINKIEY
jgi:hypothetical protein